MHDLCFGCDRNFLGLLSVNSQIVPATWEWEIGQFDFNTMSGVMVYDGDRVVEIVWGMHAFGVAKRPEQDQSES